MLIRARKWSNYFSKMDDYIHVNNFNPRTMRLISKRFLCGKQKVWSWYLSKFSPFCVPFFSIKLSTSKEREREIFCVSAYCMFISFIYKINLWAQLELSEKKLWAHSLHSFKGVQWSYTVHNMLDVPRSIFFFLFHVHSQQVSVRS